MITHFKIFENNKKVPKVGDYAIIRLSSILTRTNDAAEFLGSHIGRITKINYVVDYITIVFEEEFEDSDTMFFNTDSIEYFSKNKEVVESYLDSKKYNL